MGSNRFNFSMLALYFFCLCLWRLNGVDFVIPWPVPHYLDRMLLREHFFQSMLYLHMQPPLYNLILGMGIKLQAFAPLVSVETILFLFQTLCGGATIYYFAILSSSFIGNARCARICALIFTLNPALYLHLCAYYYTCFDAMLLLAAAWHLHRLHASGKLRHFLLTGAAVVLLANTHVLFHFVWATAVILGAGGIAWRRYPQKQALIALATVALLALVFAWPVKNKMLLGRFTASTWLGWNLSMDLPIELALISADPNSIPPRYRDVPAVANPYRSSGEPNANFYGFMIANDRNQALATQFLLHNPGYVGNKALLNYLYFCRNSARHSYFGSFEIFGQQPGRFLEAWLLAFERVFTWNGETRRTLGLTGPRSAWFARRLFSYTK